MVEPDDANAESAVEVAVVTVLVPPASRVELCAVRAAHVVVAVGRAERHEVRVLHRVGGVAAVPANVQQVLRLLTVHAEGVVIGVVVRVVHIPQLKSQLVVLLVGEVVEVIITDPELLARISKSIFVFLPSARKRGFSVGAFLE